MVLALNYVLSEVSDYHSCPVFILPDRGQNLIGGVSICKAKDMVFNTRKKKKQKVWKKYVSKNASFFIHSFRRDLYCTSFVIKFSNSSYSFKVEVVNWIQGCIIRSILPSGMGARGVSSEHVENMEMLSGSPLRCSPVLQLRCALVLGEPCLCLYVGSQSCILWESLEGFWRRKASLHLLMFK